MRREVPPANLSNGMQSFLPRPMTSFIRPASNMRHIASEPSLDYSRPSISAPSQQPFPEADTLGLGLPQKESSRAGTLGLGLQLTPLQTMLIARDSTRSLINQERSLVKGDSTRTTNGDLSSRPATGLSASASASNPRVRPPGLSGGLRPHARGGGSGGGGGIGSGAGAARGPRTHPNPFEDRAVLGGGGGGGDRAVLGGMGGAGGGGGGEGSGGGGGGGRGGGSGGGSAPSLWKIQMPRLANSPSTAPISQLLPRPLVVGGRDPSRFEDALGQVMTTDDL